MIFAWKILLELPVVLDTESVNEFTVISRKGDNILLHGHLLFPNVIPGNNKHHDHSCQCIKSSYKYSARA